MRGAVTAGETASPTELVTSIEAYLAEHPTAVVLEDGLILFDMRLARYSIANTYGRCVLQLWSEERNLVRSVISLQLRTGCLRIETRRMGVSKPSMLELVPNRDRRSPTAREAARRQYLRLLERVLGRNFPEWKPEGLRSAADLEHSFGPAYVRGHLMRGTQAEAVVGVGPDESSAMVDGVLTLGILWLEHCRERSTGHASRANRASKSRHYGGLKVIVPTGAWRTTAERMAWLNSTMASFQLFTLDERSEKLTEIDYRDTGNFSSRLIHAFDARTALERTQCGVERLKMLIPQAAWPRVEVRAHSATEVGVSLHGLEFARVRQGSSPNSFGHREEITFGAGAHESLLTEESESLCRELLLRLFASRNPDGLHADPLFRLQPERWLESRIRMHIGEFLPGLRGEFLYSQVPAITSGDRGMLDLLTVDRAGRLTILEVKADEDMQLPLQGLDYWIRVRALNADRQLQGNREIGAFERQGYFAGTELAPKPPMLLLVAPALRIHPSNETILRYLSPDVEWELIAISEHWRRELKPVFRKRSG